MSQCEAILARLVANQRRLQARVFEQAISMRSSKPIFMRMCLTTRKFSGTSCFSGFDTIAVVAEKTYISRRVLGPLFPRVAKRGHR